MSAPGWTRPVWRRLRRGRDWLENAIEARAGSAQDEFIRGFRPDMDALEERPVPVLANIVLYVILALLAFALLWSMIGSMARIVVADGKVSTRTPLIVLQPFATSRIVQMHVKAGDHVRRGEVLVSFDPAFAQADVTTMQHKALSLTNAVERLEAEMGNRVFAAKPGDPQERQIQAQIYGQEMAQYKAEMAQRDSRIGAIETQVRADEVSIAGLQQQLTMANKVVGIRQYLLEQKAGAPIDVMTAQSTSIDIRLKLKNAQEDESKLAQQRAEIEAERRSFLDKWQSDHNQQLVQARQDLTEASQTFNKASRMADFTAMKAPSDGTVLEVADRSVGSVLREAETLVTMVPDRASLYVEANVSSRDIAYIKVGDPVRVKLEAYPFQRFGVIQGVLDVISADSIPLKEGDNSRLVYRVQVRLTDSPRDLAQRGLHVRAGLTARAEIEAGRRRIISYILDPILRTADESMREP